MPAYDYDDPDAGRLLAPPSTKRKRHQVRVQGRLVLVRSVSAVQLAQPSPGTPTDIPALPTTRHDPGVGQVVSKQRRRIARQSTLQARPKSYGGPDGLVWDAHGHDGAVDAAGSETEEDEQETALRDRQRRGYGIGGAGNIRRPTEVVQFYSPNRTGTDGERSRRRWQWMSSLLRLGRSRSRDGGRDADGGQNVSSERPQVFGSRPDPVPTSVGDGRS